MTVRPSPDLTPLDRIWLTEAVRLREEHAGPLDDDEANRQALAAQRKREVGGKRRFANAAFAGRHRHHMANARNVAR